MRHESTTEFVASFLSIDDPFEPMLTRRATFIATSATRKRVTNRSKCGRPGIRGLDAHR
jgi:hypothetical protein